MTLSSSPGGAATPEAAPPSTSRRRRRSVLLRTTALGTIGIIIFLGLWQLVPTLGIVSQKSLPTASETFVTLAGQLQDLEFWRNIGRTLTAWSLGLIIATLAAVMLGTIVGLVPVLRRATHTTVEFLRPIPSVALIPLAILAFGLQLQAALVIIVFASFWQVFVQVLYGVADIDSVARDTARSFALPRSHRLRYLVLPTALPYVMTGLRLAASVALILAVTAEMTINNPGLGLALITAYNVADMPRVYAIVVVTGVLGLIINLVFQLIERRALSWHQSVRAEVIV